MGNCSGVEIGCTNHVPKLGSLQKAMVRKTEDKAGYCNNFVFYLKMDERSLDNLRQRRVII